MKTAILYDILMLTREVVGIMVLSLGSGIGSLLRILMIRMVTGFGTLENNIPILMVMEFGMVLN